MTDDVEILLHWEIVPQYRQSIAFRNSLLDLVDGGVTFLKVVEKILRIELFAGNDLDQVCRLVPASL